MYFIINNSANGGICNIKSVFVGDFENQKVTLITAEDKTTTIKKVGTICLILNDNAGKNWSYDIPDVVYDPGSPYSLPLNTNKLIYWIKILLRYSYWISDAFLFF